MAKPKGSTRKARTAAKVNKVMNEYEHHELHSGSKHGPIVTSRRQAIAIALAEARAKGHRR